MIAHPTIASEAPPCRICGNSTHQAGTVHGAYSQRDYSLRRCDKCRYSFVSNPWTDFDQIYNASYYAGQGADPLVDYQFELLSPDRTVRQYEWHGVWRVVEGLVGDLSGIRWLDFGCGNGGLVRYLREAAHIDASGFEEGAIVADATSLGIPFLSADALIEGAGSFDVVTAIEVLEHTVDPVAELRKIRRLLRPGGLLFVTTGNAAPFAGDLSGWSYVIPELHISFFEPETLAYAMTEAGFRAEAVRYNGGFDEILKFKVLKNLRIRRRSRLTDVIPAKLLADLADRRVKLRDHPVGYAI